MAYQYNKSGMHYLSNCSAPVPPSVDGAQTVSYTHYRPSYMEQTPSFNQIYPRANDFDVEHAVNEKKSSLFPSYPDKFCHAPPTPYYASQPKNTYFHSDNATQRYAHDDSKTLPTTTATPSIPQQPFRDRYNSSSAYPLEEDYGSGYRGSVPTTQVGSAISLGYDPLQQTLSAPQNHDPFSFNPPYYATPALTYAKSPNLETVYDYPTNTPQIPASHYTHYALNSHATLFNTTLIDREAAVHAPKSNNWHTFKPPDIQNTELDNLSAGETMPSAHGPQHVGFSMIQGGALPSSDVRASQYNDVRTSHHTSKTPVIHQRRVSVPSNPFASIDLNPTVPLYDYDEAGCGYMDCPMIFGTSGDVKRHRESVHKIGLEKSKHTHSHRKPPQSTIKASSFRHSFRLTDVPDMDYGYDDCDWPVGNDMSRLSQPQYAIQRPIAPHEEHDFADSWAEPRLMEDNYLWGNCSNILDINDLLLQSIKLYQGNDLFSSFYPDAFSSIPDVHEEISSPVTETDISSFGPVTFDPTFEFGPLYEPWSDMQTIFEPTESSSLGCQYDSYHAEHKLACDSSLDLTWHRREHAQILLDSFSGPNRCPWNGCTSRAKFANPKFLNIHLINIHVEPLVCGVNGCGYQKPFRNKHDLERHKRTAHMNVKEFECPYPSCSEEGLGFVRKDKLLVHFRDVHSDGSGRVCPILHCGVMLSGDGQGEEEEGKERMGEHMKRDHGSFECALGRCGGKNEQQKPKSLFSDQGLEKHLKREHEINGSEALRLVSTVRKVKDKTVRWNTVGKGCT
ncbi:hypothetical protein SBOR_8555 [Sclerotinia borealis F-4128]|uniref:C2H2-type domain-containing protein n=1 Tax=Sclerotinia borealis (strain F-4128) TaxID=1432307 RepID=W9C5A6_SCLBF|nr:hypothetical protein SBOR_8555 [Sclerotinia borealis F-4128]